MKLIPLTQGKVAIVDDSDYDLVSRYKWHYSKSSKNYGRALSNSIRMHRLITNAPKGLEVDHINGDPLDNRRCNLRIVTHAQNQKNMAKHSDNKSGYKGVSWHKKAKKWQVHISGAGYLGLYSNKEEAAKAYNIAALEHFGKFARLNCIKY